MSVINTNITSMIGQSNLSKSQSSLQTSMERLSSGLRINSAKDDAAGQAIANRMTAQITGLGQAQRNANDGISLAQTAEGGLNQINDNLQRVRELTVQAQNGTNSASDIDSIQQEVNERLAEIDRIAKETDFNGTKVLNNNAEKTFDIQVGSEDGQTISIKLENQSGWNLYSETGTDADDLAEIGGDERKVDVKGFDVRAAVTGGTDGTGGAEAVNMSGIAGLDITGTDIDGTGTFVSYDDNGTTRYAVKGDDTNNTGTDIAYTVTFNDEGEAQLGAQLTAGDAAETAALASNATIADGDELTAAVDGDDATAASGPLSRLDDALAAVDSQRSQLGAVQNRFEDAITNLNTNETNLSAARSRIEDADYAVEVANMTRSQILQQAGTSVLAQANQIPQSVLSLLG